MMKPEVRDLWLGALESGDYEQTTSRLMVKEKSGEVKHCCLGVLSELHAQATGDVKAVPCGICTPGGKCDAWEFAETKNPEIRNEGMPLNITYEWSGLEEEDASFLSEMNDGGAPFGVIAAYIRRHL